MAIGDGRVHDISHSTVDSSSGGRERLAWLLLLAGFAFWLLLVVAVPVGGRWVVQNATELMVLAVEANEGTVGVEDARGRRPAVLYGDAPQLVEGTAHLRTSTTDSALVGVYTPDEEELLFRFKVNSNSSVEVIQALAPRFSRSSEPHRVSIFLETGMLRLNLPPREGRPLEVAIETAHGGEVLLQEPGQFTIDGSNGSTWVSVQEGTAQVEAAGQSLTLQPSEGARLQADRPPLGPLGRERELVLNGDFNNDLNGWQPIAWQIDQPGTADGTTEIVNLGGEKVLRFHRVGLGPSKVRIKQTVNQDVSDFEGLKILGTLRVVDQSLGVCGMSGSECPLFLRVNYVDMYGNRQSWQQGFFAHGDVVDGVTPGECTYCGGLYPPHQRVGLNQLYSYESDNLLERLAQQNRRPRFIESIELAAEGHSFETQVFDVSVVVME